MKNRKKQFIHYLMGESFVCWEHYFTLLKKSTKKIVEYILFVYLWFDVTRLAFQQIAFVHE